FWNAPPNYPCSLMRPSKQLEGTVCKRATTFGMICLWKSKLASWGRTNRSRGSMTSVLTCSSSLAWSCGRGCWYWVKVTSRWRRVIVCSCDEMAVCSCSLCCALLQSSFR
ncbi:unnamed protein product, partial [Ectocarpus sp. 8 AP-2014]